MTVLMEGMRASNTPDHTFTVATKLLTALGEGVDDCLPDVILKLAELLDVLQPNPAQTPAEETSSVVLESKHPYSQVITSCFI